MMQFGINGKGADVAEIITTLIYIVTKAEREIEREREKEIEMELNSFHLATVNFSK